MRPTTLPHCASAARGPSQTFFGLVVHGASGISARSSRAKPNVLLASAARAPLCIWYLSAELRLSLSEAATPKPNNHRFAESQKQSRHNTPTTKQRKQGRELPEQAPQDGRQVIRARIHSSSPRCHGRHSAQQSIHTERTRRPRQGAALFDPAPHRNVRHNLAAKNRKATASPRTRREWPSRIAPGSWPAQAPTGASGAPALEAHSRSRGKSPPRRRL